MCNRSKAPAHGSFSVGRSARSVSSKHSSLGAKPGWAPTCGCTASRTASSYSSLCCECHHSRTCDLPLRPRAEVEVGRRLLRRLPHDVFLAELVVPEVDPVDHV